MSKKMIKLIFLLTICFFLSGCLEATKVEEPSRTPAKLMDSSKLSEAANTLINRLIYDQEMDKFDTYFADATRYEGSNVDFGLMYLDGLTPISDFDEYPDSKLRQISQHLAVAVPAKTSFEVREIKEKEDGCDVTYYVKGLDFINVYQQIIAMNKQNKLSMNETVQEAVPLFENISVVQEPVVVNMTLRMDGDKLEISHDRQLESLFSAFFFGQAAYDELNQAIINEKDKWVDK